MRFSIPFFNSFSVTACSNSQPHEHPADIAFQANTEATLDQIRRTDSLGAQLDYYSLFCYLRKAVVYDNNHRLDQPEELFLCVRCDGCCA